MEKEGGFPIGNDEKEGLSSRLNSVIGSESINSFAKKAGLSEGTVRNIIVNGVMPRLDNLISMANTAGVTVEWLATGRGVKTYAEMNDAEASIQAKPPASQLAATDVTVDKSIPEAKAKRIVDLMIEHGMYMDEWRTPATYFVHIYNEAVGKGLTEHSITKAILLSLLDHNENSLVSLKISAEKDNVTESMQPYIDHLESNIAEIGTKLKR